ncbi:MAG: AMP-binding protein [Acidimicrobiales bacterium]
MSSNEVPQERSEAAPPGEMSMGSALSWQAARDPNRPALTMGDQTYTRLELDRAANRLARALAGRGIGKDDPVAVILPTGPKHQITCFALWKLGALVMPLPPKLVDHELKHVADLGDPKMVIGIEPGRVAGRDVLPVDFEPDPTISDEPLPDVVSTRWKASTSGGSTGLPKLIWEDKSSLIDPETPLAILHMQVDDVLLHPAGAYHNASFSQTNWGLCWGSHVILMDRFDPLEWLRLVERHRVRWAYLVPTMMSRVLALPDEVRTGVDMSSLEVVIHMAAPCPPWVKEAWIDWVGPEKIWEIYGGTEGYGATMINGVEWLAHRGSVGKVWPGTDVRDDDGAVLPVGEIGMVYFTPLPGNVFGHPLTPQTFGDMGSIDADGYLYLADRRTDMILTGGVNLYPAEIEGAIEEAPGVVTAAVIGLPDPDLGAKAHAIVEVVAGQPAPGSAELAAFLATRLSRPKVPYTCEFVTVPLRDDAGKLRRKQLREERLSSSGSGYQPLR